MSISAAALLHEVEDTLSTAAVIARRLGHSGYRRLLD